MNTPKYPKKVLVDIQKYFENERKHVVKRLKQLEDEDPFKDPSHADDNADVLDDVREELAHEQVQASREALEKRLREIEEVLSRIENGSYGFCKQCHEMINTDRLSSNPLAVLCIRCAQK